MSVFDDLMADAKASCDQRDWDQALEYYKKALEADPQSPVACRGMADVLAIRGRLADVIDAHFQLVSILEGLNDLEGSLDVASWILNLRPDSANARMKIIAVHSKMGDKAEVVKQSRELARLLIDLGRGDESIELLKTAQQVDPENLDIGLELAEMFVSYGHIQDGARQYRTVAQAFLDRGNLEKAAESFRRMKVIAPDDSSVLLKLGNLYVSLRRYNEAEQEYRSILRHDLNHEDALLALGRVCQLKKQWRDAILAFNRILTINPDEVTAKRRLGELYQAQGLMAESIKNYLSAAQSHLEFEEKDNAIQLFQIVLGLDPANPTACRELTNLGAPLVGIANEELEVPEPEPAPVPTPEPVASPSQQTGKGGGRLTAKSGDEPKTAGRVRPGLIPSADAGSKLTQKPGLSGAKPTMKDSKDAGGGKRGLMRAGLSGAGDKPMLPRREQPIIEQEFDNAPQMVAAAAQPDGLDVFPDAVDPFAVPDAGEDSNQGDRTRRKTGTLPGLAAAGRAAVGDDPFAAGAANPFDSGDPFSGLDDPFSSPSSGSLAAVASPAVDPFGDDPFGSSTVVAGSFGNDDPFASSGDPFGSGADPFSSTVSSPAASFGSDDPFAPAVSAASGDPFGDDPFASAATATKSGDPFADDPFAANDDPFGTAVTSVPPDPFGNDPFATAAAPAADPFGGGGDPFGGNDPFGGSADPFATQVAAPPTAPPSHDPFGGSGDPFSANDPFASSGDPFATQVSARQSSASNDPFGGSDPFGSSGDPFAAPVAAAAVVAASDPFGGNDPFGASSDPFAAPVAPVSAPASSDPFGSNDPFGASNDPFAAAVAPASDPFGGSDPFGSGSDPFAAAPAPAGNDLFSGSDPFVGSSAGASAATNDPFGGSDPFGPSGDPFAAVAPPASSFDESSDPFGAAQDPFAAVPAASSDPFAGSDPFAASAPPAASFNDSSDPFGAADDPFAPVAVASASNDPFGPTSDPFAAAPVAADPFGGNDPFAAAPDPFAPVASSAGALVEEDPFAAVPVAAASQPDDLFAAPASSGPSSFDPFATSDDPFAPAPSATADPFGGSDPFAPAPSATADPFGGSDPFAPAPSATADPFGGSELFAPAPTLAADNDLFAPAADAFGNDPFAAVNPPTFAPPSEENDPFAAAPAPAASGSDFFAAQDPFAPATDMFAVEAPQPGIVDSPFDGSSAFVAASSAEFAPLAPVAASSAVEMFGDGSVVAPFGSDGSDLFAPTPVTPDPFAPSEEQMAISAPAVGGDMFSDVDSPVVASPEPVSSGFDSSEFFTPASGEQDSAPSQSSGSGDWGITSAPFQPQPVVTSSVSADDFFATPAVSAWDSSESSHSSGERSRSESGETRKISLTAPVVVAETEAAPFETFETQEVAYQAVEAPVAEVQVEEPAMAVAVAEPAPTRPRSFLSLEDESSPEHVRQAEKLREQHQSSDVANLIRAYRKSVEDYPDNLLIRAHLADVHMNYGLLDDAVVQYRQILKRNPSSPGLHHRLLQAQLWNDSYDEAASTLLELSKLHIERGENLEALEALQSVLTLEPHNFEARKVMVERFNALSEERLAAHHLRQLAESALAKGNVEGAIEAFQSLLRLSEDSVLEERLAQVYESKGDQESALRHYRSLAIRYTEQGQLAEAASVTERLVALTPDDIATRESLIGLYTQLQQAEKAANQRFLLARYYESSAQYALALPLLASVLGDLPEHHEARRLLVDCNLALGNSEVSKSESKSLTAYYLDSQNVEAAIELHERLASALPQDVELRQTLIRFYQMAGRQDSVREQWLALAQLSRTQENWEDAATAYREALKLSVVEPNEAAMSETDSTPVSGAPEIQFQLALLYLDRLQNPTEALAQFEQMSRTNPGHQEAMARYVRLLIKLKKSEEAAKLILKLESEGHQDGSLKKSLLQDFRSRIEAEPGDPRVRFLYGELCYHLGELDTSIEQFQQTRRDSKFELRSYNMLGLCFAEKSGFNMLDLAIRQFRRGLETQGHSEQEYLEIRYNLALLQYRNNRLQEALQELKDCYAVDIAYRDVRDWIRRIEAEIAGGPKVSRQPSREK